VAADQTSSEREVQLSIDFFMPFTTILLTVFIATFAWYVRNIPYFLLLIFYLFLNDDYTIHEYSNLAHCLKPL
jgi:hypothetical protein